MFKETSLQSLGAPLSHQCLREASQAAASACIPIDLDDISLFTLQVKKKNMADLLCPGMRLFKNNYFPLKYTSPYSELNSMHRDILTQTQYSKHVRQFCNLKKKILIFKGL